MNVPDGRSFRKCAVLLWLVLAAGALLLWLGSLPGFYERATSLTVEPYRLGERVQFDNAIFQQEAADRGLSLSANAVYDIAINGFQVVVYYVIAGIVLWRAGTGFGLFTAFVLMLLTTNNMGTVIGITRLFPGVELVIQWPSYLIWPFFLLWIYLFPNGRAVPPRARVPVLFLFAAFLMLQVANALSVSGLLPASIDTLSAAYSPLLALPLITLMLISQIYRYARVSTPVERQQTKWFLFGFGVMFLILLIWLPFRQITSNAYARDVAGLLFLPFPIGVAIAITRYRLFDIDVLIRRTLVYGILTALLLTVYLGSVIVLQQLLRAFTRQDSDLAIIGSTLAIFAMSIPLRNRIQHGIDQRFYRRKYSAAQVLSAFATTVRDEVDLERLTDKLTKVVEETMRPESVSVWLRAKKDPCPRHYGRTAAAGEERRMKR